MLHRAVKLYNPILRYNVRDICRTSRPTARGPTIDEDLARLFVVLNAALKYRKYTKERMLVPLPLTLDCPLQIGNTSCDFPICMKLMVQTQALNIIEYRGNIAY